MGKIAPAAATSTSIGRRELLAVFPFILRGQSQHTIVLSREASQSEERGARELQRFLFEMSGARLPIVTDKQRVAGPTILVGRSEAVERLRVSIAWDALGAEGFALKSAGEHTIIAGGRKRGTLYGVYEFLERLGCRWYTPDYSRIPKRASIDISAFDEIHRPELEYRELYSGPSKDKDWAARNRVNGNFSALDDTTGGKVIYYPFGHSFYELVPPEKHYASHPEYYSFTAGARRTERSQLCLTNPDVIRLGIESVLQWIREHPEASIYSVSQNDTEGWCECPNCRRVEEEEGGAHAGPIVRFVNAIAAEVSRKHPDKLIDTFAYSYSEQPPLKARPHPNVRIRLAPIGWCQAHPYEKCARNRFFMGRLKGWSELTDHLYVWHYFTNFWQYQLPYPNLDELTADIPMYRRHGVVGMFLQGDLGPGCTTEFCELKSYLLAKMLWNPAANAGAIIREFVGAYYGAAAPSIHEYLELTHREVREAPRGKGKPIWTYKSFQMDADFLPAANTIFAKAEKAAGDDAVLRRVRKAKLSVEWTELLEAKRFVLRGDTWGPADLDAFWRRFRDVMAKVRFYGLPRVHEWHGIEETEREFAQYVKNYRAATLESETLRVVVVPGFHGRIISMVEKHTGREAVRRMDPDERFSNLEGTGGIVLLAHTGYLKAQCHVLDWSVQSLPSPSSLLLIGTCANGLEVRRRLELAGREPLLRTFTTATNRGAAAVRIALQSRVEIQPGDMDHPTVDFAYEAEAGRRVRKTLLPVSNGYFGIETFAGNTAPVREWRLINPQLPLTLVNRFHLEQAAIRRLWYRGRGENKATLCVWSPERVLAPGESISLDTDYGLE
jgi:hypothetical protein